MDDLYRDEILEHYRRPHNFGTLAHPDVSYEGANPLCGDRLTLMLDLDESGTVTDVAFTGRGCAISQASASHAHRHAPGPDHGRAGQLAKDDVLELLGIEISPARLKCALLSLDTLQRALAERAAAAPQRRRTAEVRA